MAQPGMPEEEKAKGQEKGSTWCSICSIHCNSSVILKQHVNGKRHKRRLAAIAEAGVPAKGEETTEIGMTPEEKAKAEEKDSGWCSVCQIDCNSGVILKQHMAGRRHKRRLEMEGSELAMRLKTDVLNDVLSVEEKQNNEESREMKNEADMYVVVASVISLGEDSKKRRHEKYRGPAFKKRPQNTALTTDVEKAEKKHVSFEKCEICNITCTSKAILQNHFAGKKHAAHVRKLSEEESASKGDKQTEEEHSKPDVEVDIDGHAVLADKSGMNQNENVAAELSVTEVAGEGLATTVEPAEQAGRIAEQANGTEFLCAHVTD